MSALVSIDIYARQDIVLDQGWSMISSYVSADNNLLSAVMAPVNESIFLMKDIYGQVYWPSYNFNQLGSLSNQKGYKILMDQEALWTMTGRKSLPNESLLSMDQGWHIMPYLRENPAPIEALLEPIQDQIIIVKDAQGHVYWPDWGINSLGDMEPGKAYQIKLNTSLNFNYPANAVSFSDGERLMLLEPEYFSVGSYTADNMTLGIPLSAWDILPEFGDEIAVCDAYDRVVAAAVYQDQPMVMSLWANDEHSNYKDGLLEGESFQLKLRKKASSETYSLKVNAWAQGSNRFEIDEIIEIASIESDGLIDREFQFYPIVPNPANSQADLQFYLSIDSDISLKIYNLLGELVYEARENYSEGLQHIILQTSNWTEGSYIVHLESTKAVEVQSLQILH